MRITKLKSALWHMQPVLTKISLHIHATTLGSARFANRIFSIAQSDVPSDVTMLLAYVRMFCQRLR